MKASRRLIAGATLFALLLGVGLLWQGRLQPLPPVDPSIEAPSPSPSAPAARNTPSARVAPVSLPAAAPSVPAPVAPFNAWVERYQAAASPAARSLLIEEGRQLASQRSVEMLRLIKADPERALAAALPYGLRKQLPPEIAALIEQPVSGRGEFKVLYSTPVPGRESEVPPTEYEVTLNRTTYRAHPYGSQLRQPSRQGLYLSGIVQPEERKLAAPVQKADGEIVRTFVEHHLALRPAGRVLERDEAQDLIAQGRVKADAICGTTGRSAGPPDGQTVIEFGGHYYNFCRLPHAERFNDRLIAMLQRPAAGGDFSPASGNSDNLPPASRSITQGRKRLLYMPVLYADDPRPPQSQDAAQDTVKANNQFYKDGSYGTVDWETTVTPPIQLPQRANYYGEFVTRILSDAIAVAATMGIFAGDYDQSYVLFNNLPQVSFGGRSDGLLHAYPGAISHELGHNFFLPHANFWDVYGASPGPVQPTNGPAFPIDPDSLVGHYDVNAPYILRLTNGIPSQEYGNPFDVMGSGPGHFGVYFKNLMNWLPDPFVKSVTTAGTTNRIYAFDTPHITDGRLYAMRIYKDYARDYWAGYRQGFPDNPWLSDGIELTWNLGGNNVLLDLTPASTFAKVDSAVIVGRTFNDPAANIFLTPVAKGGGPQPEDKWIDVVVQIGPFPGNQAPSMSFAASALNVTNGSTVTFTASAHDPDGDAVAFNWDFGNLTFGINLPTISKTFTVDGRYVVRCEVSDMRGGVSSSFVVVTVGTPGTYTISGRVVDIFGNPVQGVRVHNSGERPPNVPPAPDGIQTNSTPTQVGTYRYSYTDSQGYYTIGNIPAGTYTNRAFIFGYRTDPLDFTDPVRLTNGSANNLNFIATPLTKVHVTRNTDAQENVPNSGAFTFTREGDLSEDMQVRYILSGSAIPGSAIPGTDYTWPAGNLITNVIVTTNMGMVMTNFVTTNIPLGQLLIPAGLASADLVIDPLDNGLGDGSKTVLLTLLLQTNLLRISTMLTNVLTTNGPVVITNTMFVQVTNQFRIPGWELRPSGPNNELTWFQTDPTYVLTGAEASLSIVDEETPELPMVGVVTVDSDAVETRGDMALVAFFRTGAPFTNELDIHYTVSGTAVNGVDYQQLSGTAKIPAGEFFVLVPIVAINDLFVEGNETADITIVDNPSAYTVSGGAESDSFVIVDDDLPLLSIYAADSTGGNNGDTARVTISRAGDLTDDLLVNYLVTGTASSGQDFVTLPGSVVIPVGSITADVVITPINNATSQLPKTVTILLSDSTSYNIFNQNSATVRIIDSSLPTVSLEVVDGTGQEGAAPGTFRITRGGPTTNSLLVYFDVGGSAWEGADYAAIGTNVLIPVGATGVVVTIASIEDTFHEQGDISGFDTVILQLQPGTNYNLGSRVSGMVTIEDNDPAALPAVGFMLRSSMVREDASTVRLAVKISANPATNLPVVIEYRITSGSAVPNVNYTPIPGVTGLLNFIHYDPPPGETLEDGINFITIPILNDNVANPNRNFIVTLFDPLRYQTNRSLATNMGIVLTNVLITRIPTNAYLSESHTHVVTIVDVGAQTVTIAATTPRAYEAGPQAGQFLITRTGPTNASLTVRFAVAGTAASGNDFAALGFDGTITIPAGTNRVRLYLPPLDDPTEEVAESVRVTLLARPGYRVGSPGSASLILVSDDGTLQFTSARFTVPENAGPAVVGVQRTGNTNAATTVDYRIFDGTATNGLDYLGTNGTLSFAPGELLKTITVGLIDDALVEAAETVSLVLTNPSGGVPLGGQRSATLYIDNDDTSFAFATNLFRVNENAGTASLVINRLGLTNATASVYFVTTNDTARAGSDFTDTRLTVNFAPGETNAVVEVPILDDASFEGNEAVNLILSQPSANASLGAISNSVMAIIDDESSLEFTAGNYDVNEYAGSAVVTVHRSGGTVNAVTVGYATRRGSASNTVDYVTTSGTLTFAGDDYVLNTNGTGELMFQPGQADRTISIPILDDVLGEGSETFSISISNALGPVAGSTRLGTLTNATVTILDNETPGNPDYEYFSGLGANARVRAIAFQQDQRVVFAGDFTLVNGISLNRVARLTTTGLLDPSFNPGAGANGSVQALTVQSDNKVLIAGTFSSVDGTNRARIARLQADGNLDLSFDPGNGPNGTVRALATQSDGKIIVAGEFTLVNGVNRAYVARLNANGSVDTNFNAVVNNPVYTVAVTSNGKVLLGGAFTSVGGTGRSRLARVNNDGTLDLGFEPGSGANNNVYSLAVQVDGKVLIAGTFNVINGSTFNFLARLNADGTPDSGFNVGNGPNAVVNSVSVHQNGKIAIGGDFSMFDGIGRNYFARLRPNGTLDVLFNIGTGANAPVQATAIQANSAVVIGGDFTTVNSIARGRIARIHGDEKSNIPNVEFAAATFSVVESNTLAVVTVLRGGGTNSSLSVQFTITPGTATAGVDYSGTGSTLAFAPGETTKTFSVQIFDDSEFELDETIRLSLTNATAGVDATGLTQATLVIVDDEKGVQFSAANYFVAEEATNALITVVRSGQLNGNVSVQFQTGGGTALPGIDYLGTNTTLVFTNGESTKTILLRILDDNSGEADETVTLNLSNPVGAVTNAPFVATLYITNSDQTFGNFPFASTNKITIVDGSPAVPYPSTINVSGLTGVVARVTVTLVGLTHTFPADIDMLLVGPAGQSVVVMSDAGGAFDVTGINLRFEDGAAALLPQNSPILAGASKPSNYEGSDTFASSAPAGPYGSAFSAFAGSLPNGDWKLYVMDDRGADVGEISNGWRLEISTVDPALLTDLAIGLTDAPDPVLAGQPVTYAMSVTNLGPLDVTNARLTNTLPANMEFISASAGCTNFGGTVICSLGALTVNATAQVVMTARPLTSGTYTDTATIGSSLADVIFGNSSATVTTTVTPAPVADLALGLTDAPDPVLGGSNIVYTINITNRGPLTATAVVVSDNLPAGLAFVSAVAQAGSCNVLSNAVTCNLGDLASGARSTITLTARTLTSGLITNTVTAASGVPDFTPAVASTVTTVQSAADLFVYQIESADPVALGTTLTYTIVVTNRGVSTAVAVNLIDALPSGVTFVSAFPSQGGCANVANLLICDLGSITNHGVATVSIDVDPLSLTPLINAVNVAAIDFDPNTTNNFSSEVTTVFAVGSKSLFITPSTDADALAAAVTAGGATGIRVNSVALQAHDIEGTTSSGIFSIGPPPFTYNLTQPGIVLSSGDVRDYESGPSLSTGNTTGFGVPATPAQEALLDPITGVGGQNFRHWDVTQLDIRFDMQTGFDRIEFKVVFGSEEYPEFVNSSFIDGFGIYLNGSNIAYTAGIPINIKHPGMVAMQGTELDGVLAPGGNPVLTFSATVIPGSTNNLLTFIVADTSDPVLDTTVYVSSLQGGLGANSDLSVNAAVGPEPLILGNRLTYTFNVQNRGPSDATNVVVVNNLPSTLSYVSATPSQGSCGATNGTVTCALGAMARSTTASITLVAAPVASGRITNTVSVTSELLDLRPANNSASAFSTVIEPGAFSSTDAIILPDAAPGFPYPATITVSGLGGMVSAVTVQLVELSHSFPADLDVLLVGPGGQKLLLMSDAGGGFDLNGVTLKFEDGAPTTLSQEGPIASGTFRPTDYEAGDLFTPPAPAGPYATTLSVFNGTAPNGIWSLYIMDDRGVDSGVIAAGWRLNLQTTGGGPPPSLSVGMAGGSVVISWPDTATGYVLYGSASVGAGAIWTPVGIPPTQVGGNYTVTLPPVAGSRFYRLEGP